MIQIISGTNRVDSVSKILSQTYQGILSSLGHESNIIDLNDLPEDFAYSALYNNAGKNQDFNIFRETMLNAEKFVFIVPEYNGSFPGVLKTFIDGLQFPDTFKNKKAALVGLSSGIQGAGLALSHLTDIFNYCGMHILAQKPKLMHIEKNMKDKKELGDFYTSLLQEQAEMFIAF
ncbi:MAG: NAD(P)H-dependent oxidoreductase [Cyclobacteriaceae bacterium]|nr:NAD(P)H-dependent oxidoreductase [Cyclobacteriaceae bacterium]